MGARLMAIVAEGARGRVYLAPTAEHEAIAQQAQPSWKPETALPDNPRNFWTPAYGLTTWGDLFTPRQLVALTTFSDLVPEAIARVRADALAAGMADDGRGLDAGGTGATAYAEAVGVYLGLAVDKTTDYNSSLVAWSPTRDQAKTTFGRQALPMVWDYAEINPMAGAAGDLDVSVGGICRTLSALGSHQRGAAQHADAQTQTISANKVISTDPPYYDNIGYADLSDFFYVWLRRSLRPIFPTCTPPWPCLRPRNWWPRPTATAASRRPRTSFWTA
jgi:putative DNA methylase